jgi:hypothetical protein
VLFAKQLANPFERIRFVQEQHLLCVWVGYPGAVNQQVIPLIHCLSLFICDLPTVNYQPFQLSVFQ